ncbi:MAG: COX15/CtaA family protein [Rubellimicrobium sp.]|nr:COX15/CtaA family protein [Rubellimicrobium sp.]
MTGTGGAKGRMVFEEVASGARIETRPGGIDHGRRESRGAIRAWLWLLFVLVALMIAVGGLTRLTGSGLSITEWNPVTGAIPPLNAADWQAEYDLYRASPQYENLNQGMELREFQFIYWWEWGHRQLGRLIGLVWAAGWLGFLVARRIPPGWTWRLFWPGVLIGVQGAIGWWMVHSGLQDGMIAVASYRLATHLGVAFLILGLIAWDATLLRRSEVARMQARRLREPVLARGAAGVTALLFVQILLGALVAGIDAGRAFPTWPLMGDGFLPPFPFDLTPLWRNFFENDGLVQFIHRMTGYLVFVLGLWLAWKARSSPHTDTRRAFGAFAVMLVVQVVLGIVAVLTYARLDAAITHQIGAVVLWVLILRARVHACYPVARSVRD